MARPSSLLYYKPGQQSTCVRLIYCFWLFLNLQWVVNSFTFKSDEPPFSVFITQFRFSQTIWYECFTVKERRLQKRSKNFQPSKKFLSAYFSLISEVVVLLQYRENYLEMFIGLNSHVSQHSSMKDIFMKATPRNGCDISEARCAEFSTRVWSLNRTDPPKFPFNLWQAAASE